MSGRKKISQREAMRTRRDLKRLREFVSRISGAAPDVWLLNRRAIGSWNLGTTATAEMLGADFGAQRRVVFVARRESAESVSISAVLLPQEIP